MCKRLWGTRQVRPALVAFLLRRGGTVRHRSNVRSGWSKLWLAKTYCRTPSVMSRAAGINSGRVVKGPICALRTTASSEPRRAAARRRVKIEPFRIKAIEPLHMTTREERLLMLQACHWNLFKIPAKDVVIDFLTDSGTGAMSSNQWSAIMVGDESYAGSQSWYRFQRTVQELTGHEIIIPTHQGRAAERILFQCLDVKGKGNIDLEALERLLRGGEGEVAAVVLTVTNNTGGGQPVSLENMRGAAALCKAASVPFYLDACRFAENAWFIKQREPGAEFRSIRSIANEMFSLADGCTFSAKKDGLANIGGFITTRDVHLGAREREVLILTEGYPTYGGLAGRDLDAIATGLQEVVDEGYLEYRIASTHFLAQGLLAAGVAVVQPAGGHAVYIDAGAMLPHIPPHQFPGHAIACAFFLEGGIRSCEIGSLMFGGADPNTGSVTPPALELCRMAIPRRVYTQSHIEYVLEVAEDVVAQKDGLAGFEIVEQPQLLRHFSAKLRPLTGLAFGPVAQQAAEVDLALGAAASLADEQPQGGASPA